jgi:hypothetical protein
MIDSRAVICSVCLYVCVFLCFKTMLYTHSLGPTISRRGWDQLEYIYARQSCTRLLKIWENGMGYTWDCFKSTWFDLKCRYIRHKTSNIYIIREDFKSTFRNTKKVQNAKI